MSVLASLLAAMLLVLAPADAGGRGPGATPASTAPAAVLRVGTFNVDRGRPYAAWRRAVVTFRRQVDVAGLQEVSSAQKRRFLGLGDRWGSYGRSPGPDEDPVVWDRRVLRATDARAVRIAPPSHGFPTTYATVVRLTHRASGQRYTVLNVHLAWGHRPGPRACRSAQLRGLARVVRHEQAAGRLVLVVGDFNVDHRDDRRDRRAGYPVRRLRPVGLVSAWESERLRAGGGSSTLGAGYIDQVWAERRARDVRAMRHVSGGQHHPVVASYVVPTRGQRPAQ